MDGLLGLLRVRVVRGINLAIRDTTGSDPYVVLRMGDQKLKTSVKNNDVNPVWNEDLTLTIAEPIQAVKLKVYDKDTFTRDDEMGDADIDIEPFLEAVKMNLSGLPTGTIIRAVHPNRQNCLAEESTIVYRDDQVAQDMILRLKNVETGELELQLLWITIPGVGRL